jgi:hypothetical protein
MTRYLKILFLATLVIGLMAGSAFAQAQLAAVSRTVALEKTSTTAATLYDPTPTVTPVFQAGGAIAGGETITLTMANGVIKAGVVDLCDGVTSVATVTLGANSATAILVVAGGGIGAADVLTIRSAGAAASCEGVDFFDVLINGGLSNGAAVTLSSGPDPLRMAAGPITLYTLTQQLTATLTSVTSRISFSSLQKGFVPVAGIPGSTPNRSTAKLLINSATLNDAVTLDVENFTIRITGNLAGVTSVGFQGVLAGVVAADVTAGYREFTVTGLDVALGGDPPLFIEVNGTTVLSARSFTATFSTTVLGEIARAITLLSAATSHTWVLDATNFIIPLVGFSADGTRETFIKIFSKSSAAGANSVSVNVLATDGTMVALTAGTITPGVAFTITGSGLGAGVVAAGKTVNGVQGFPAILSINTPAEDLFIFANLIDPSGAKVIPVTQPLPFGPF